MSTNGEIDAYFEEAWKHTTMNNFKVFSELSECICHIQKICSDVWHIEQYQNGAEFITKLLQSVDSSHGNFMDIFEYIDDNGDMGNIVFVVKSSDGGKSIELSYTYQKLKKPLISVRNPSEMAIGIHKAFTWLKQRVPIELRLSNQDTLKLMSGRQKHMMDEAGNRTVYHADSERILTVDQITHILQKSRSSSSYQGWRYLLVKKSSCDLRNLRKTPEILKYIHFSGCDQEMFFNGIQSQIENLENPVALTYPFNSSPKKSCALQIVMQSAENGVVEMACQYQDGNL